MSFDDFNPAAAWEEPKQAEEASVPEGDGAETPVEAFDEEAPGAPDVDPEAGHEAAPASEVPFFSCKIPPIRSPTTCVLCMHMLKSSNV